MSTTTYTLFADQEPVLRNAQPNAIARQASTLHDAGERRTLLVFADDTGRQVDLDAVTHQPVVPSEASEPLQPRRRGRPRLGVTSREVTLLPRHWAWLERRGESASIALRRLVEGAMREDDPERDSGARIDAVWRVMNTVAGNLPGYEEAARSLYRKDWTAMQTHMADWPDALRTHLIDMLEHGVTTGR